MTTHYILADDYDRWNPGEPIEDVESDVRYLMSQWASSPYATPFQTWLDIRVSLGTIIRIETDENGRILP